MGRFIDLTGQRFGRLTVVKRVDDCVRSNGKKRVQWLCKCSCKEGNEVIVCGDHLKNGHTKSCGCYQKEMAKLHSTTHGFSNSRLESIFFGMKNRCYNKNSPRYKDYGMKGIRICNRWLSNREEFFLWALDNGYNDTLSIDRVDNDGDYCPENCRWVTSKTQANNTSRNRYVTYNGKTMTISQWSDEVNIPYRVLLYRITAGWDMEDAFRLKENRKLHFIEYRGERKTMAEWSRAFGIPYSRLKQRINKYHWEIERALNTP